MHRRNATRAHMIPRLDRANLIRIYEENATRLERPTRINTMISFMQRLDVPRGAININDGLLPGSLDNAGCVHTCRSGDEHVYTGRSKKKPW